MLKNFLLICLVVWLLQGCKTIDLRQRSQTNTTQQVSLGSVGLDKDFILQEEFNNAALPNYTAPLKISVKLMPFNKQAYKAFNKAEALQSATVRVNYIDSVKNKPRYIKLQIADKVAMIDALNDTNNRSVKNYLGHNAHTNIITSISWALGQSDIDAVMNADAVFLVEKGLKTYVLQLYKGGAKTQVIPFNRGVVFGYKGSNCCWQENNRRQINIVDLVSEFSHCPNKTYRSSKRAKKKTKLF
ncbi:hypothetical protein [Flavivirga sp. 57AJ16]|uniref:hypothetical protein n=1 Tax=Flavivirga sp. 57AJ16 TaxID=3025307 RepID=UPI002365BD7C|nr:hypothetical protein [Flavivirga sp. 57AJ16]MDD7886044.1 hypothetical protein [Flavivirga sp. 57AJ16]